MQNKIELAIFDDWLSEVFVDRIYPPHQSYRYTHTGNKCTTSNKTHSRNRVRKIYNTRHHMDGDESRESLVAIKLTHASGNVAQAAELLVQSLESHLFEWWKDAGVALTSICRRFKRFSQLYLGMFHRDAGYEIVHTGRYRDITNNDCDMTVIATRHFNSGQQVHWLSGQLATLSNSQSFELRAKGADFSVMQSARTGRFNLFLGPARFVNHDCMPNCEFISVGDSIVSFRTVRPIKPGEELTVSYGDHYFGDGNCDCLCDTCQGRSPTGGPYQSVSAVCGITSTPNPSLRRSTRSRCSVAANYENAVICLHPRFDATQPFCSYCERHKLLFGLRWPYR
jgi:hypothetical protein